jgi:hypothetical protein
LGKLLVRYFHLDWNDRDEQGVLKSYTNDKFSGSPTKMIYLKQYAARAPVPSPACRIPHGAAVEVPLCCRVTPQSRVQIPENSERARAYVREGAAVAADVGAEVLTGHLAVTAQVCRQS